MLQLSIPTEEVWMYRRKKKKKKKEGSNVDAFSNFSAMITTKKEDY
jgi:hypothetical protein